jgi:predicted RNA-binding Zn-ribbon protein involved in translation (DUF1610 family)
MSTDLQISLPPWPMARLLKEASAHWNLLHPDNIADPEKSDWPLLCNVVHSFLRHQQTQYEQVLAAGADREELHDRISRAASRFFPWLRVERDPRTSAEAEEKPEDFRPFNEFSRRLSDLVSERARLIVAIKDARRKRLGREHIAALEERLARVNARTERLNEYFKPAVREETGTVVHSVCMEHSVRRYNFAGRELAESYTRSAGFKCPACGKTVMRSKVPMEVGAGKRNVAFSCHCLSLLMEPAYAARVRIATWQEMLAGRPEKQNTSIIVLGDNRVLYGHELIRDIAEGRKDAEDATIFRDVQLAAFQALLLVRYGDHECVRELGERDEVTTEQLKRISAEIILTAAEIELVLAAQEAELRN